MHNSSCGVEFALHVADMLYSLCSFMLVLRLSVQVFSTQISGSVSVLPATCLHDVKEQLTCCLSIPLYHIFIVSAERSACITALLLEMCVLPQS